MLRYDFRDRPLSSELLDDVYWKVDLDKCKKVGQVLQEAEETLRPLRSKGDKFLFETKTHSFTTFYGKVEPATLDLIALKNSRVYYSPKLNGLYGKINTFPRRSASSSQIYLLSLLI